MKTQKKVVAMGDMVAIICTIKSLKTRPDQNT